MTSCGGKGSSKPKPITSHRKSSSPAFTFTGPFVRKASVLGEIDPEKFIVALSVVPRWSPALGKACCVAFGAEADVDS